MSAFPKAGSDPFTDRCENPGYDSRWTCPGCYEDILSGAQGTFQCKGCGRKVHCTVEYQPSCVAIIDEGDEDA